MERKAKGEGKHWEVDDAPRPFVDVLKKAIVGFEVEITRLEGRWKMSQEMKEGDREGVVEGLRGTGTEVGIDVARVVEERGKLKV